MVLSQIKRFENSNKQELSQTKNILLIKDDKIESEEKALVETFNNHYIHKYS